MENLFLKLEGFNIFGLYISFYGLIIALAMVAGVLCAYLMCKQKGYNLSMPVNVALYALPCAIIGARLYYCALNGVESFIQIFKIWEGGMAIYGGVLGGFIGIVLCCLIHKYSLLQVCDLAAPCLILGQAIGRVGCYFAGCCYGVETTIDSLKFFPLSVEINGVWHLSTFFYEGFCNLIGFVLLIFLFRKTNLRGSVTSGYFIIYGTVRAVLEQFRDPEECLMLGNTGIRASQLLSVILVIIGVAMIISLVVIRNKKLKKSTDENIEQVADGKL